MEGPVIARREVTQHILHSFGLGAKKKLGQNFLVDEEAVRQIAQAAELVPGEDVLEIGPGIGTLTQALAETGAAVTAVELDRALLPVLTKTLGNYENVKIINGDILKVDILGIMGGRRFKVAANLPYYITTPIIFSLLEQGLDFSRLVVMVQKEVAERMTAAPGGKDYGALSLALQYYTQPRLAFTVGRESFLPAPHVDSAVVVCDRREAPPVAARRDTFFRVVRAAFSLRRKMLNNSLKNAGRTAEEVKAWLAAAEIDGTRRAETLSMEEFGRLAECLDNLE